MAIRDYYDWDNTVFDGVVVPEGIDRQLVINQIMMDCGLLESVYSTPGSFALAVRQWFATHQWTFEHLLKVVQAEYSPIENTDRYSEHTIGTKRAETENTSGSRTLDRNVQDSRTTEDSLSTDTDTEGDTSSENTVSAYNSSNYQPDSKVTGSNSSSAHSTSNEDISEKGSTDEDVSEEQSGERTAASDQTETYDEHTHGNIGVTTNQQMINEELAMLKAFNIYQFISNLFMDDFCILVW